MAAGNYNIIIDQGSDFTLDFVIKDDGTPRDLTGYSARAQLRRKKNSVTVSATFTCSIPSAIDGEVRMELGNSLSTGLTAGIYYYDLELYTAADANVIRILQGEANLTAEVTR